VNCIKRFAGEPPNYPGTAYALLHSSRTRSWRKSLSTAGIQQAR
jgi:hypothetical protein